MLFGGAQAPKNQDHPRAAPNKSDSTQLESPNPHDCATDGESPGRLSDSHTKYPNLLNGSCMLSHDITRFVSVITFMCRSSHPVDRGVLRFRVPSPINAVPGYHGALRASDALQPPQFTSRPVYGVALGLRRRKKDTNAPRFPEFCERTSRLEASLKFLTCWKIDMRINVVNFDLIRNIN